MDRSQIPAASSTDNPPEHPPRCACGGLSPGRFYSVREAVQLAHLGRGVDVRPFVESVARPVPGSRSGRRVVCLQWIVEALERGAEVQPARTGRLPRLGLARGGQ